jgi:hypothetical protein
MTTSRLSSSETDAGTAKAGPPAAGIPAHEDPDGVVYVYLCHRCGQPLRAQHDLCNSALHVGSDGLGTGRAIRSTELARLAGASRAALGAR